MSLKSFKKYFYIALLIPIAFFTFNYFNAQSSSANITSSGNNYYVTTGDDLFSLLSDTNSYFTGNKPTDINIKVKNDITLPDSEPNLYNFNSVNVDFQGHGFYVNNETQSALYITKQNNSNITISNLNINNTTYDNYLTSAPNSNGNYTNARNYYTSNSGMLFTANGDSNGTNSQITYNNINYYSPNNNRNDVPLSNFYVKTIFTGNNKITANASQSNYFGILSNIEILSGETTFTGFSSNSYSMINAYPKKNSNFEININNGAKLNLNNNTNKPLFALAINDTNLQINNNGELNIISRNSINDESMAAFKLNANENSKTLLISQNNKLINNGSCYSSANSIINFQPGSKSLFYSNYPDKEPNFTAKFTGTFNIERYFGVSTPPTNIEDNYTGIQDLTGINSRNNNNINNSSAFFYGDNLVKITSTSAPQKRQLQFNYTPTGPYNWTIPINQLSATRNYVSRNSPQNFKFDVTSDQSDNFSISAAYNHPNNPNQPFDMIFRKDNNSNNDIKLDNNSKKIIDKSDMTNSGTNYTKDFDSSHGLIIKADNHVKAKTYTGTIDWTLNKVP
ncbi:hypothetical protein R4B61_02545 [Fructilactobacillus vespulae]|uniref:hypothetical protein n=1 Tax=Fructilactobacillus vespulae TaxID=1249630 RepID=UPI0039B40452